MKGHEPKQDLTTLRHAIDALEARQRVLELKLELVAGDSGCYTVKAYCALHHITLPRTQALVLGRLAAVVCRKRGWQIGSAQDETFGRVNVYPEAALDEAHGTMHDQCKLDSTLEGSKA
ncbi:MAG: hypothetical protein HC933_07270 [Pleurocapsa sp. SU_196_0]|nr:hypothetical protein [Pleurocapsa sp. SU_196_0]